jgi:PhnB protein
MNTEPELHLDIYINYAGRCEEAFKFYEKHLGGKITMIVPHREELSSLPADWKNPVQHATLELGGTVVRGSDIPNAQPMRSAYLTLRVATEQEAERVYYLLSEGGEIFMKLEKTFFANRFAMLRDQFGTSWMIMNLK